MTKTKGKTHSTEVNELDPLLITVIYNLLKNEAKFELNSQVLTLKTKKAWTILEDEMFNVRKTLLFENLLLKMVQDKMIALDKNQKKIIFKK